MGLLEKEEVKLLLVDSDVGEEEAVRARSEAGVMRS